MDDVPSLATQTLRHLSLEQLLEIGFDRLPTSDEFYRALGAKLHSNLEFYYDNEEVGWLSLEADILFLTQNEKQPLIYRYISAQKYFIGYKDTIVYWRRQNGKYLLIWDQEGGVYTDIYNTLDELVGKVLCYIFREGSSKGSIAEPLTLTSDDREVFGFMKRQHQKQIEEMHNHLKKGELIMIDDELSKLSVYPFTKINSGYLVLDEEKLTIISILIIDDMVKPDITWVPIEDAHLILSILAYNPDTYRLTE